MADDAGEQQYHQIVIRVQDPISEEQKRAFRVAVQEVLEQHGIDVVTPGPS